MNSTSCERFAKAACLCLAIACIRGREANAEDHKASSLDLSKYVEWMYPVAIQSSNDRKLQETGQRLVKILDTKISLLEANENPGCAFWLKVEKWAPNPGQAGYIIVIQPGGAILIASESSKLDAAVTRIEKMRKTVGGKIYLPLGLVTDYPISQANEETGDKAREKSRKP
jgi:hypothetical protein